MDMIPMEWIDKIFAYMEEFFKEEWTILMKRENMDQILRIQWQTGLTGLSKEDIKRGLSTCRLMAASKQQPPHVCEFYHYCKGLKAPPKPPRSNPLVSNPQVAKNAIESMRKNLRGASYTL